MQSPYPSALDDDLSVVVRYAPTLSPSQRAIAAAAEPRSSSILRVPAGMGPTTILKSLHTDVGGLFIAARDVLGLFRKSAGTGSALANAMERAQAIFLDDAHLICGLVKNTGSNLLDSLFRNMADGKTVVAAMTHSADLPPFATEFQSLALSRLEPADYAHIATYYLGASAARLDMREVHRLAPALTAFQIKNASLWLGLRHAAPDTSALLNYLGLRRDKEKALAATC